MTGANLIVFRDASENVRGKVLRERLLDVIAKVAIGEHSFLNALLLAGEVECSISDRGLSAENAMVLTDMLARLFVGADCKSHPYLRAIAEQVASGMPEEVRITHPEGFAYYALHPGDFADALATENFANPAGVVGIRSIGTTLSAVTVAEFKKRGIEASRITLRPTGHPYARDARLDERQKIWIRERQRAGATFLIVDEGPGLSGSSFLSVAECLAQHGVDERQITMLGTTHVDARQLCAPNAYSRWKKFKWQRVQSRISRRFENSISLSGGAWRDLLLPTQREKPACWPEMDEAKHWSQDRKILFKFEGLGEFGSLARGRSHAIYEAGFGPCTRDASDGMSSYGFISGRPLARSDLSSEVLNRIAGYCAFRLAEFKINCAPDDKIEEMLRFNFRQETGREFSSQLDGLHAKSYVVSDSRMHPHEWIAATDGRLMKVDGSRHGDDHFFPGPTDIAWDLAGAIVEWDMSRDAQEYLLRKFRTITGFEREATLPAFLLAYSVFRASYCKMALLGTSVGSEKPLLLKAHGFYRRKLDEIAAQSGNAA